MADAFEQAYQRALRYLARQAKTCREIETYLNQKGVSGEVVEQVISRLLTLGYLNDKRFADQFIESRIRFKPKSRFALGYELKAKGIDESLAQTLLEEYDDLDLALKAVAAKQDQWRRLDPETCQKKVMNYLRYRGFDYGICRAVWEKLF